MAPLVDVIFLLVIFFAVSTTFLETAGLKLELPASSSSADQELKELTVLLDAEGTISFEEEIMEPEQLSTRLAAALEARTRKLVVLRADKKTSHGDVVKLMDLIREAGAEAMTVAARASSN
jgi:biopolymer transport protein ExbD/biopolymer transport protein TolR